MSHVSRKVLAIIKNYSLINIQYESTRRVRLIPGDIQVNTPSVTSSKGEDEKIE